ncbi:YpoC family protein [Amphibacillus cookii]|uniref:YpoC family protein n=1 Tax=Amphibacillus cookii TaxID=767787 RepID=UPI00195D7EF6|nr:hypothetical protein [Amphibacillus cookii]MBM7542543.1 hypothetical protein [Amphibacillus cookii]
MNKEDWIEKWKYQSPHLSQLFHNKHYQEAVGPMGTSLNLFIDALYHLNQQSWSKGDLYQTIDSLEHKPFNIGERVHYIASNLSQYHAYIQLDALYQELEKLYAKVEVLELYAKDNK